MYFNFLFLQKINGKIDRLKTKKDETYAQNMQKFQSENVIV